jgi:hypothetical protein
MSKILTLMIAVAGVAAAMCFDAPASLASGDAPWCAVISLGTGEVYWDCRYRTVEECVPNVIAGNRGFCNVNPWPGPGVSAAVRQPKQPNRNVRPQ